MSSNTKNTDAAAGNNVNTSPHIAENTSQKYQPDDSGDSDGSRVNPSEKYDETILPGYVIEYYAPQVGVPGGKRRVRNATISSLCPNLSPPVNGDNHSSFKDTVIFHCKYYYDSIDIVYYYNSIDTVKDRAAYAPNPKVSTDDPDWVNAGDDDIESSDEVAVEEVNSNGGHAAADSLQAGQGDAENVSVNANTVENANMSSNATISGNGHVTSTKRINTTRNRTSKRGQSGTDALLEEFMKKKIKRHDDKEKARQESENDYNAKKVRLAKQFRAMTSALNGDKLRAAKVCPDFKIFLSTDEKVELATL
eukprot:CAMPEP_0201881078 /NCGR_PEP_ID=MMETSP0902-20130614/11488_1 /ASSEMBLY_ACC=CAM_ASM_000551 /TAXON_ID=420261 /ORGANISM="Thalassiosira antarctica, Strain CCMP982" /LENGTH=307 /DNA_ID=CAMNT_0048409205 /DNA_START=80 /DNA_END=1003 /DNA_ORIENTATION=+